MSIYRSRSSPSWNELANTQTAPVCYVMATVLGSQTALIFFPVLPGDSLLWLSPSTFLQSVLHRLWQCLNWSSTSATLLWFGGASTSVSVHGKEAGVVPVVAAALILFRSLNEPDQSMKMLDGAWHYSFCKTSWVYLAISVESCLTTCTVYIICLWLDQGQTALG